MKPKDIIAVRFRNNAVTYYAQITEVPDDGTFTCRFVHNGATYVFEKDTSWIKVISQTGGAYKPGTVVGDVTVFAATGDAPQTGGHVVVGFDDGNVYFGTLEKASPMQEIKFLHSGNSYSFDSDLVAHKDGGTYDGRKALAITAYDNGTNLFLNQTGLDLTFTITNKDGIGVRGAFAVIIKKTGGIDPLYSNTELLAEDSNAKDSMDAVLDDGDPLTIFLTFHPAVLAYDQDVNTNSPLDYQTSIKGTHPFKYNAGNSRMHFDITFNYDSQVITASSNAEATKTLSTTLSASHAHTDSAEYGVEAEGNLFLAKVTAKDTHTDSDTGTTENGTEEANGTTTGTAESKTYTVYYPLGLKISDPT